ncbi:MAG: hypothetical protein IT174_00705 [Acidobacteria bacterium]|nr:hypothetical protein [Acidobacteriota bacterium]
MRVRGVVFAGRDFAWFEPENEVDVPQGRFSLCQGGLCDFRIEFAIPLEIAQPKQTTLEELRVTISVGGADKFGFPTSDVSLELTVFERELKSRGTSQWFEDELLDIQAQLPTGCTFRSCFGCAYSDYSVYGHGFFGNMLCFRNIKDRYSKVKDKDEYMEIMDLSIETVQETYVCPEFAIRRPGTGYRG